MGIFRKPKGEKNLNNNNENKAHNNSANLNEQNKLQVKIKVPDEKVKQITEDVFNGDYNSSSSASMQMRKEVEAWGSNSFKRHEENKTVQGVTQGKQGVQNSQTVQVTSQGKVGNVGEKIGQNKINNDNTILGVNLKQEKGITEAVKVDCASGAYGERLGGQAVMGTVVETKKAGSKKQSDVANASEAKKTARIVDKALQERSRVAYLPIYYDVFDLDGKTYGKMVRCYLDNSNKIVGFNDNVENFETEAINVAGYIFADRALSKILSDRYLNVKMANLNTYLTHLRRCGKTAETDITYNKVKNHFIKISNEYLKREAKNFNFEELKEFNIDFGNVMLAKDCDMLQSIIDMKLKYKQYNFDKENGKNNRLNSAKTGKNKVGNVGEKMVQNASFGGKNGSGEANEDKYRNYMPLFCVLEEDYSLSTVSIYCEWFKNGNVAFEQGFEITKGFDIDMLGNIYEDKELENQLNESDYIVGRLKNLHNAYCFMKDAMVELEKAERYEKGIYRCEDLVGDEGCGVNAKNGGCNGCEKIEFYEDCGAKGSEENANEQSEIEALVESGKIDVAVNVGAKVYGAIAETKKAFYLIAKKFLDADTAFDREKDNLNATLIVNQLPQIAMDEVCNNILVFRDRIDFITDKAKGIKVARPKIRRAKEKQSYCKMIDFNVINKEDIRLI